VHGVPLAKGGDKRRNSRVRLESLTYN